jgi:hypothetical protein
VFINYFNMTVTFQFINERMLCALFAFVSILVSPVFAADATNSSDAPVRRSATIPRDPVLGTQRMISVWSYSKAFAKRFNLSEMAEEGLPPDIWAMELRLIWRNLDGDASFYDCELHTYVNNQLKIFYPEGEIGSIETLRMEKPAQPAKMLSAEDRGFHGDMSGRYGTKAIFSSYSDKKPSLGGGITYLHYRKYFLSDLAYLAYRIGCSSIGNPNEYQFSLWIEKEGGPDYRRGIKEDTKSYANNFYQFPVPKSLVQRFYPHAKLATDLNSCDIDEQNRRRRDNRTKEYWEKRNRECSQLRNTRPSTN